MAARQTERSHLDIGEQFARWTGRTPASACAADPAVGLCLKKEGVQGEHSPRAASTGLIGARGKSAIALYKQQRYSVALEEYLAAYILQPYPPFLYNVARLHHKQDHLREAIAYYQRYLDSADPGQPERAKQYLSEAQEQLAAEQTKVGPTPAPPALAAPPARIMPVAPTPPPALSAPAAPSVQKASVPVYKRWWVWTLLGVAAAGAATAVGIGVYASGPDISGLPTKPASLGR